MITLQEIWDFQLEQEKAIMRQREERKSLREQKQVRVIALLKKEPELSNKVIAARTGVSSAFVGQLRRNKLTS